MLRLLILEDDPFDAELEVAALEEAGYSCRWERVETRSEFLARLDTPDYDLVLADYNLPAFDGLTALSLFLQRGLDIPFVLISGVVGEEIAIESLKAGATDYVLKDRLSRLGPVVQRALREKEEQYRRKQAEEALRESEEKYRQLVANTDTGFVVVDEEGRVIEANEPYLRLVGVEHLRDIAGRSVVEWTAPESKRENAAAVTCCIRQGYVRDFETVYLRKDGRRIYVQVNATMQEIEGRKLLTALCRDVTARVRAEQALRESEAKYRSLIEQSGDAIYLLYQDHFEFVNSRFEEMFGATAEEVCSPDFDVMSLIAPSSRALIVERMRIRQEGQTLPARYEFTALNQSGQEIETEVSVSYVPYRGGTAIQGVLRDISERVRSRQALQRERDLFRALTAAAAAVSRTLDPDEVLDRLLEQVGRAMSNDAANVMLVENENRVRIVRWRGYDRFGAETAISTVVFDLDAVPNLKHMVESREPMVIPDTLAYPGWVYIQEQTWLRSYASAPICVRGVVVGFLNIDSATPGFFTPQHADILRVFADYAAIALQNARLYQSRVRAERLLSALNRAALAITRATTTTEIFDAAAGELKPLGLSCVIFILDENEGYLYPLYLSHDVAKVEALEALSGLERPRFAIPLQAIQDDWQILLEKQAILIKDVQKALEPLFPDPARQFAQDIVRELNISSSIVASLLAEGRMIGLLFVQGENLTRDDVPTITAFAHQMGVAWHKAGLMQSLQDNLDKLKRTQTRLVQAQKMEAIGRLAGGVAHDFNNHLTAIHGYAEMVLLALDPQDPRRQDVREIQRAAERSSDLTRQLLAFSRKQVIQPKVLNLNSLIETMRKMLGRLIGEDIELCTAFASDLGRVKADPGQIEQVVMNLTVNARDAINEKKGAQVVPFAARLTIETANVELDETYVSHLVDVEPGLYVMLSVSDNGAGMDSETMSHLFEPFFTTKEQGRGTGLGLSTVYGIVKQNGGYVFPYSEPGVGTTFKVYLPCVGETAESKVQTNALPASARGSETILLVEDEDAVRALARRILAARGYHVLEAANADDALDLCRQHADPIHLVLTDVVVPGLLSSKELIDRVTRSRPEIAVIYMSGYTDDVIAHHGVLDPGIQFVQKPFTPNSLAFKVRRALDAHRSG